jgi:hypothetical protein
MSTGTIVFDILQHALDDLRDLHRALVEAQAGS